MLLEVSTTLTSNALAGSVPFNFGEHSKSHAAELDEPLHS